MLFRRNRLSWTTVLLVLGVLLLAILAADYLFINFIHSGSVEPP